MKKHAALTMTLAALLALTVYSPLAADGARRGLSVCAGTLAPSLFPFFVLANLLSLLGLPELLSGALGGAARRLFRVSGAGAQAFLLGVLGGYPLGAATTAQLRRDRIVSRSEAERLLAFCNNSGPAFILGAAGGVLGSPGAGLLLYVTHILAAVCVGLLLRKSPEAGASEPMTVTAPSMPFTAAFGQAVSKALRSTLAVCAYVVFFSALLGMLTPLGRLPPLLRALAYGFWELGGGISALRGLAPTPLTLAAAALLLGWGGVSVHCQTLAAVADTDIKCARHLAGRALCGVFAAVFTYLGALVFFR